MNLSIRIISLLSTALFFTAACGSSNDKKTGEGTTLSKVEQVESSAMKTGGLKPVAEEQTMKVEETSFIEGKHYVEIFPEMQTDAAPGKVEVVELMWLGCPHCYKLEPAMIKYRNSHPDFVEFKQVPAMLNPSWAADAKTFYIAELLDPTGEKELVTQIFAAIHEQKRRLRNPASVIRFFGQLGFSEEQVKKVQNSMAYKAKLTRAEEIGKASQANSVPTIIINGKYRTGVYMAGSEENLMKIIEMLTNKENK